MTTLVNGVGFFAGAAWLSVALYFQFVRYRSVDDKAVSAAFAIGVALWLGSIPFVFPGAPTLATDAAIVGNLVFLLLAPWAAYQLGHDQTE